MNFRKPGLAAAVALAYSLWAQGANAAPQFVQGNYVTPQGNSTAPAVKYTKAQVAGDLNVIAVGWLDSSAHVKSIVDSMGNTYKLAAGPTFQKTGSRVQSIYYAIGIAAASAGANTVTVTFDRKTSYPDIRVAEYSGIATTNTVEAVTSSIGNSATSTTRSVTTTGADLLVAANFGRPTTVAAGSGATSRVLSAPNGHILEDLITTQPGSYSLSAPLSYSGSWVMQMVAFRAATVVTVPANHAPVISGAPATSVQATLAYSFQASASDADRDPIAFSIANKPVWATFNTATGALTGTPTASQVGAYAGITISVSDGKATAALPAFTINVTSAPVTNHAPTIGGTATASVTAGNAYSFAPTASDADSDPLTFSVSNLPVWAAFDSTTGRISGTPSAAQVGTYSNIVITVSDGKASASLPGFSIAVTQISLGSASLSWTPPLQNTDGSQLTDLAGYHVYYGTSAGSLTQAVNLGNAGLTSYVVQNLSPGTYYFAVTAYNTTGVESALSGVVSKTIQ